MIITCNILTKTKNHDVYDEVAVNKFPIIITDECTDVDSYCDGLGEDGFILEIVRNHVKNDITFENAKLYIRFFNEDSDEVTDKVIIVNEKITYEQWKS